MKKHLLLFLMAALLIIAAITTGCGGEKTATPATPPQKVELNVSAAVSLKDALAEIQKNYETKNANVKLIYNLGASGALQKQIEQGAPADIFVSAAPKQMNDLEEKNLVNKATRKNLVENKLVVIVPTASTLNITKYEDLTKNDVQKVSIGETGSVPAGQYAQEVLKKLGIWDKIQSKAVLAKDVRTVLTYVETGNVEAGIVYKTDAVSSDKVKVAATAPEGSHQPILYPAAVLSGTKQEKAATDFLAYLSTPECKTIFEKYGFTMSK
ncbi:molybdate ABC transporter substrate-binding protein [Pelosinus baikalensis]|uniref:Molybdate ABC transporter substrate-binding protein n=1 Tax=Pelosinus baikalensis TaxID=2892015 RepID=A0ABS8HY82_9FIRM|nr:molybdate ABC transporter substrate-binding protein [Pelosinus baikalensis]MCC5467198.1 molybdate ABC transporter substrate-binding protein [Pelosinus baikalensis]